MDAQNFLYYGDNLDVLRRYVKDETVDLVYLDPPFNSNANYNVLFSEQDGSRAAAQVKAFGDTWEWDQESAKAYHAVVEAGGKVSQTLQAFRLIVGDSNMLAYLSMMAPRLAELRRVMKPTSSIYLHCDPTASHYLKLLMDAVFAPKNFRNEIVWQRTSAGKPVFRNLPKNSDSILWYTKGDEYSFQPMLQPLSERDIATFNLDDNDGRGKYNTQPIINPGYRPNLRYIYKDLQGREWQPPKNGWRFNENRMHESEKDNRLYFTKNTIREKYYVSERVARGKQVSNVWTDIPLVAGREFLGYPTQKPEGLLARIIRASSSEGDVVLDPFCGCGTAIAVAQRLNRQWIGIDITHLAITLLKHRLKDAFGDRVSYKVIGEPVSVPDAKTLAQQDPYQFQWWALGLVGARPTEQKKGADKGIDGRLYFHDDAQGQTKQVIFSVKAGKHLDVSMVRDLGHVVTREKAQIGVLISMEEPTKPMLAEAAGAGFYQSPGWNTDYPRLQLLTIADLLDGKKVAMPPAGQVNVTFKKAPKAKGEQAETLALPLIQAEEDSEQAD